MFEKLLIETKNYFITRGIKTKIARPGIQYKCTKILDTPNSDLNLCVQEGNKSKHLPNSRWNEGRLLNCLC